jgi:hypothetical protein
LVTHYNHLKPEEREETIVARQSNTTIGGGEGKKMFQL